MAIALIEKTNQRKQNSIIKFLNLYCDFVLTTYLVQLNSRTKCGFHTIIATINT